MNPLFALVPAAALAFAFAIKKIRDHRRAIHRLAQAVAGGQPHLRESEDAGLGGEWDRLCEATNDLISAHSRLQALRSGQLVHLEATLGSLQEAVLLVDDRNEVLLANPALKAIFPRAANILGQRLEHLLQSRDLLSYVASVRAGNAQPRREVEFADGAQSLWVEVTGALVPPLDGAGGSWALFVLHDVTQQRRLENVRRDFVANVSHELRTPLSVIKGYVETLVDGHREMAIEDRDRFLLTIQRHSERLNSLVEDLLTLSRLESGHASLNLEPTDLGRLVAGVVADARVRPAAVEHSLAIAVGTSVGEIPIDAMKMAQVFENLVDNALKYTPKGSRVDVTARRIPEGIEACVRDNGPGIPADDLPHIFDRFYRVEKGRSREKGGTGLGLSIVKHIVQLHGGRVWVESVPGKGSAFFLTLPVPG